MYNLYAIVDIFNHGFFPIILIILSLLSIIFSILVITIKNPIVSVLFLIGLFFSIACYLISIGATFIGISYLLVYVGAVSILFLFILMLINIRVSELITETKNSIPLVFIVTLMFININNIVFPKSEFLHDSFVNIVSYQIYVATYNNWENNLSELSHVVSIGNIMYTNFSIWLILASLILLLAMVGSIVVTLKQKADINEYKTI